MNYQEVAEVLEGITFLDLRFSVYGDMPQDALIGVAFLKISLRTPDTRDRSQMIEVNHMFSMFMGSISGPKELVAFVFERVVDVLKHEAQELYKVHGFDIYNPHEQNEGKWKMIEHMLPNQYQNQY